MNAPSGLQIVVKEHPRTYGRRGRDFFAPLQEMPNVTALHPMIDNYKLVAGAEAIVAVTGSVGIEGILLGKRVGVLGRPYYAAYRGVKLLDYPEDIFDAIAEPTYRPQDLHEERRRFFAAYTQSLYDFGYGPDTTLYPRTGGARWADILREVRSYLVTHGLRPLDFETGLRGPLCGVR
jgi:capsule polysaccharide export protein KpsC/LpsZ